MKVYVVVEQSNKGYLVDSIFASEKKANEYAKKENSLWGDENLHWAVDEWEVE